MWKIPVKNIKIRVMKPIIIKENVGLDISMADFKVSFVAMKSDLSVVVKGSRTFPNTQVGYTSLVKWSENKSVGDCPLFFTMEATGIYYEGVAYHLFEQGYAVSVVLPNQAKKYSQSLGLKSKTDQIDAKMLAQFGLERNLPKWEPLSPHFRILKILLVNGKL